MDRSPQEPEIARTTTIVLSVFIGILFITLFIGMTILAMTGCEASPTPIPCVPPAIDLHEAKYLALCDDYKTAAGVSDPLTGQDCEDFLQMAWTTSDETVSPDFALPADCLSE
ncbi:MAG: hypothetical protein WC813_02710 [Patescibacteria group bacterium]|jgi:hypothetical protein